MPSPSPLASDDDVGSLFRRFADRTLPKAEWTHAAHLAVAVAMISRVSVGEAARRLPPMIRAYNAATGVANTDSSGYHETITMASLRAVAAFVAAHREPSLHATLDALIRSPYGRRDWMLAYWSRERLFSAEARRTWCEPDLAPLPF